MTNLHIAWLISLFSTLYSLYQSIYLGKLPCGFCQLQRMALFPLPILLYLLLDKPKYAVYLIPFPIAGLIFSSAQIIKQFFQCETCQFAIGLPIGSLLSFACILFFQIYPYNFKKRYRNKSLKG